MNRADAWWTHISMLVPALAVLLGAPQAAAQKFYPDDPVRTDVDDQDASRVRPADVSHARSGWKAIRGAGDRTTRVAMNVNSLGEVPDSSWFTNRIGSRPLAVAEISHGPDTLPGPPSGPWTVVAAKTDGVMPGLRLKDAAGRLFFVKFDPPDSPEMASGAEVVATKLLFAAGYWVPENYVATLQRADLAIGAGATFTGPDGKTRPMSGGDVDGVLKRAARNADGSYRMVASLTVGGRPLGPFQYFGTRRDDPNDIVPHEHRRELRGFRVFAAWLNHVDSKGDNSLDTLLRAGGRDAVRHYLLDFGSALGSAGTEPKDPRDGYEYGLERPTALRALLTLGAYTPSWRRIRYPRLPGIGLIESTHFQPEQWKPTLPNPAFRNTRPDDTFWAAQRVMAFSDDAIRAVVAAARYSDASAARYLSEVLIDRRDRIGRSWLTNVNPISNVSIDDGGENTFRNAASDAGVTTGRSAYVVRWSVFDNTTHVTTPLGPWAPVEGTRCRVPADVAASADFLMVEIGAIHPEHPAWATPVRAFFRRDRGNSWRLVGFERLPADV
jgi:hypothetical protein